MPPETPVGLFGVGLMGEVYAARLIAAGFGVIGFDIGRSVDAPDRRWKSHGTATLS
jgi:3-hydroxyisobutyrate dehydrogenase-like beta-hydroxyacid dehydrogenase